MAWYYGTYSCGHEGRVNIVGPQKDRPWKIEHEFKKLCPDCYQKKLAKERAEKAEMAEKEAKEMELPELSGSEKQIAWANTLRMDFINFVKDKAESEEAKKMKGYSDENRDEVLQALDNFVRANTEAKYWIDNRFSVNYLLSGVGAEYKKIKGTV